MSTAIHPLRRLMRGIPAWRDFREMSHEGFMRAAYRVRTQRRILSTGPVFTAATGPIEIRALTWRRDWLNLLWALKSLYHYSKIDYPLYIHDGGLEPAQREILRAHFPNCHMVLSAEADRIVEKEFHGRGLERCLAYRRMNPSTRKLFDFFCMSTADILLSVDSDIVFFAPAQELVDPRPKRVNCYNQDHAYFYSMPLEELKKRFGLCPPDRINSGLSRVFRESLEFPIIEEWLHDNELFADKWVTEQTIHALASARFGVKLLPPEYALGTGRGLPANCVCKHYPGYFRPLLYEEGMAELISRGFLEELAATQSKADSREVVGVGERR